MSAEAITSYESWAGHKVSVVSMEIEPNSIALGEIGRNFWLTSQKEVNAPSFLVKSWDGRVSYHDDEAHIEIEPVLGAKDESRHLVVPISYDEFLEIVSGSAHHNNFVEVNDTLDSTRQFIETYVTAELDGCPEISII